MKKVSTLLCLAAVALLAGCNGGTNASSVVPSSEIPASAGSSSEQPASQDVPSVSDKSAPESPASEQPSAEQPSAPASSEAPTNWSDDILSAFAQYIYEGYELPFVASTVIDAYWDDDYECFSIELEELDVDAYLDVLEAAGYELVYNEEYEMYDAILVNEDYFRVEVEVYEAFDETFEIDIYPIPAYAEWPSDTIEELLELWGITTAPIEYPADAYYVGGSNGLTITCLVDDAEAAYTAYAALYEASADWKVYDFEQEGVAFKLAASTNKEAWVQFYADEEEEKLYITWQPAAGELEWPGEDISAHLVELGLENPTTVPSFEADIYSIEKDEELYYTIQVVYDEAQTNSPSAAYAKTLTDAGWSVTSEEGEDITFYTAFDAKHEVVIEFNYYDDDTFADWGLEFHVFTVKISYWQAVLDYGLEFVESWPSAALADFILDETVIVPAAHGTEYGIGGDDSYQLVRVKGMALEDYLALLTGWTITTEEEHVTAVNSATDPTVSLGISEEYGYLWIYVTNVPREQIFDFSDESQLVTKDAQKSVWSGIRATFTVEKGNSAQNVGNGNYFANPLRIYKDQVITIETVNDNPIEFIEFECNGQDYATAFEKATFSTGRVRADSATLTWFPESEDVTSLTITLSAQVRLEAIRISLA